MASGEKGIAPFPHWNWAPGQDIDMWAYYNNADEVELFVNGKSQGVRTKGKDDFHVVWRVKYEPGVVKSRFPQGWKNGIGEGDPYSRRTSTDTLDG